MISLKNYVEVSRLKLLLAECMWTDNEKIDNEITQYNDNDSRELLGMLRNDELVGLIGAEYKSNYEVELKHIAVKPNYRGQGIGGKMIKELLHTRRVLTLKAETDHEAVGFYKTMGFSITSLGEKYPGVERFECIFIRDNMSQYLYVQSIAKAAMNELMNFIKEGVSEKEIATRAESIMREKGINRFWYYDIGAFVHVGERTTRSESGRNYEPSDKIVGSNDIVTVDLSPEAADYWGDFARTFVILNGQAFGESVIEDSHKDCDAELLDGMKMEQELHQIFMSYVSPERTFEEVYVHMNEVIVQNDYTNLDFAGNLGHTIEFSKDDRLYFERGNQAKLSEAALFTFEPHIKHKNGKYGFKREDIYYFHQGVLCVL